MSKIVQIVVYSNNLYGLDDNGVFYLLERNTSWTKWKSIIDSPGINTTNTPQGKERG